MLINASISHNSISVSQLMVLAPIGQGLFEARQTSMMKSMKTSSAWVVGPVPASAAPQVSKPLGYYRVRTVKVVYFFNFCDFYSVTFQTPKNVKLKLLTNTAWHPASYINHRK